MVVWLLAGVGRAQDDADAGVPEPELAPPLAASTAPVVLQPSAAGSEEPAEYGAVAVAPAPGARQPLDRLPNNVQRLDGETLREQHPLSLSAALNARLGSVTVNDVQNNPLQPDVQYRGYTASPLLGTPQGIAVYQNGVRLNEPFGEVMQWDLIPLFALADIALVPGENPAYGLNTLGGSLVLRMKDGFAAPGYRIEGSAGSFARYRTSAEYGHNTGTWAGYAGASLFDEQGYRDKSHSSAQHLYADLRRRETNYEFGVGLTLARTNLYGNGPAPIELLRRSRSAVYTWPDNTQNNLVMLSVDGQRRIADRVSIQGGAYLRHLQRDTLNGDATEVSDCAAPSGESVTCNEEGEPLRTTIGTLVPGGQAYDAVFNTTRTLTTGYGASLQLSVKEPVFERANQFVAGVSYDGSHNDFSQRSELGHLTTDRGVVGGGPILAGAGSQTDLIALNHMLGVYAVDTWSLTSSTSIHISARLNWLQTQLLDRLGTALDGTHRFVRVNPAIGFTQKLGSIVTLFGGYGESNRAPSAAELACADPDEPCRLPNAFISDPPLKQVVSRSVELGLRARLGPPQRPVVQGSLAVFGARNHDDILFVSGSRVGTGYFQNAGETQRVGLEAALSGAVGPVSYYASYTLLRATFESELELPRNAAGGDDDDDDAEGGRQEVEKGSRIPGLPMHAVKAGLNVRVFDPLVISVSMLGQSSQPFRGDESNQSPFVNGYVLLNAQISYQLFKELSLFVRGENLLDTNFNTFGVLSNPGEVLPGATDPRFLGRGAPLGVWAGVVLHESP